MLGWCTLGCMPRPPRICEHCGVSFTNSYPVTDAYWARRRFCSPLCSQQGMRGEERANRGRVRVPLEERFWKKVDKRGPKECWPWTGARFRTGYGFIHAGPRGAGPQRWVYAHRLSWLLHSGELADSDVVCHHCDNPPCVNPAHLFIGTRDDNNKDRDRKGRGGHGVTVKHSRQVIEEVKALSLTGISQSEIARRVGVSQQHISRVLRGAARQKE